jgi:hypothetical protein
MNIAETCSCGASFEARGPGAVAAALAWRGTHNHPADSVGICADAGPREVGGIAGARPRSCTLRAGHQGAHADGEGTHWWMERKTAKAEGDA